ncbi:MAG TPA: hypothetical protein VGL62_05200, partial [Vicinamibacterales bacterium]
MISRRHALKTIGAAAAVPMLGLDLRAQTTPATPVIVDERMLDAIAEVTLPSACDRHAAVAAFQRWIRNYREGADMDHGYGF